MTADDLTIAFFRTEGPGDLIPDRWGIPAPDPGKAVFVPPEEIDLVLVPLLAVDRRGTRLGKGGGCYDRYFAAHSALLARSAGVALGYQLVDRLPADPWDCRLPAAVTPQGVLYFQ